MIPRPEQTPEALRAALAVVAPSRIEIARRPDLSARRATAEAGLEHPDALTAREALEELSRVLDEAMRAVRDEPSPLASPP